MIYFLVICILHLLQIDFLQATVSEYYINNSQYEKFEFLRLSVSMLRCVIFLLFQFCMLVKENKQQFVCFVYINTNTTGRIEQVPNLRSCQRML